MFDREELADSNGALNKIKQANPSLINKIATTMHQNLIMFLVESLGYGSSLGCPQLKLVNANSHNNSLEIELSVV